MTPALETPNQLARGTTVSQSKVKQFEEVASPTGAVRDGWLGHLVGATRVLTVTASMQSRTAPTEPKLWRFKHTQRPNMRWLKPAQTLPLAKT
jgi:hypothetical protein